MSLWMRPSPVAPPIGELLAEHRLSEPGMTADSFFAIAELLGLDFEKVANATLLLDDGWVVDQRERLVIGAVRVAERHTSTFGMTNIEEIRQQVSTAYILRTPTTSCVSCGPIRT